MRHALYYLLVSALFALLQLLAVFMAFQRHNENIRKTNLLRGLCWLVFFTGIGLMFYLFAELRLEMN